MAENDQLALHFTEAIARYMQAKFRQQLEGSSQMDPFSDTTNWRAEEYVKDLRSSNGKVEAQNILQPFHPNVTT